MATAELEACLALLTSLDDRDWAAPTDCAGRTVHELTAHLAGQYRGLANPGVYLRRHRRAHRRYPALSRLDAGNRQQIDDLGGHTGRELAAMLAAIGPQAIRARRRIPGPVRRQRSGRMYPEEPLPDDRLGYVLDVLGLRDPWMHRVDLARATGRPLLLGAHDRVITAQVIADLAQAWHGPPVLLELTGPAGGRWTLGRANPRPPPSRPTPWTTCAPCPVATTTPTCTPPATPQQQPPPPPASYSDRHRHTSNSQNRQSRAAQPQRNHHRHAAQTRSGVAWADTRVTLRSHRRSALMRKIRLIVMIACAAEIGDFGDHADRVDLRLAAWLAGFALARIGEEVDHAME